MNLFTKRLKELFRSKEMIFWSLAFPILLGTLFNAAFKDITSKEKFTQIPVAVVVKEENKQFMEVLKAVDQDAKKKEDQLFKISILSEEKANKKLEQEKIEGYIIVNDELEIVVKESNIRTSILNNFINQYLSVQSAIERVATENPQKIPGLLAALTQNTKDYIQEVDMNGQDEDPNNQYFYGLIAMACLFCGSFGIANACDIQGDISTLGCRRNVAPTSKMKMVLMDTFAAIVISYGEIVLVLLYLLFVLKRDFGDNLPFVFLAAFVGVFTGIGMGTIIAIVIKGNKDKKEGINIAISLGLCFCGGLMMAEMIAIIEKYFPLFNRINPAALLVNAFHSLLVYDTYEMFYMNIGILFGIGVIFYTIAIMVMRRKKYASI